VTTTTTTRPATTTTSTTSPNPATTTTTTGTGATTTTTAGSAPVPPAAVEICGNCIDDDQNGAIDFEDGACCAGTQRFEMVLRNGRIKPRGGTSALRLKSSVATAIPSGIDPKRQDVFVQIRGDNGAELLCAQVPATRFMIKHKAFLFWDKQNLVASAKGLTDMALKVRRNGRMTFGTHGRRVQLSGATQGNYQITIGFRDSAQVSSANRCAVVQKRFRAGAAGSLLAR
jgi:hypothetical protein